MTAQVVPTSPPTSPPTSSITESSSSAQVQSSQQQHRDQHQHQHQHQHQRRQHPQSTQQSQNQQTSHPQQRKFNALGLGSMSSSKSSNTLSNPVSPAKASIKSIFGAKAGPDMATAPPTSLIARLPSSPPSKPIDGKTVMQRQPSSSSKRQQSREPASPMAPSSPPTGQLASLLRPSVSSEAATSPRSSPSPHAAVLPKDTASHLHPHSSSSSPSAAPAASAAAFLRPNHDAPWSVSVAEVKEPARETRKKARRGQTLEPQTHSFTIYVTTPTHNLTLQRSAAEIQDLDARLREGATDKAAIRRLPTLPSLPASESTTRNGGKRFLQTISRTLSPGGPRIKGSTLSQFTSSLTAADGKLNGEKDSSSAESSTQGSKGLPRSPAESPDEPAHERLTPVLASYFTALSNISQVRQSKPFKRLIRVRTDDLESVRIERRIHRVQSDLAQHVKSSVAPTNTKIGAGGSNSDIGEDGGRTEDERDAASLSGGSVSRQSTNNSTGMLRPNLASSSTDMLGHITSSESLPDALAASNGTPSSTSKKAGSSVANFADIPEEVEKERVEADSSSGQQESSALSGAASSSTGVDEAPTTPINKRGQHKQKRRSRQPEKVTINDFDMLTVLGKGCAGKVLLVRHKPTSGLFAMKSIHKRHVLAHQELQHTLTEQSILKRMAAEVVDPFVVKLWWSFHDKTNLYLVMDFHPGGDLATQLSRWGRLGKDRARFYAAEIVEGVEGLHNAGVIYRDLKPENVLIGADGHIVLSDFGLSKEFPRQELNAGALSADSPERSASSRDLRRAGRPGRITASDDGSLNTSRPTTGNSAARATRFTEKTDTTATFCGTAEYLAPEVIQGSIYSYEVDWWSFGTMLYEMLTGVTPFWAETHADMYVRVLHDELVFPEDYPLDTDTRSILRGLLQRNPMFRMKQPRIKAHPYFSMIDWDHVFHKRYIPPYIPPIDPADEMDTQNFDEMYVGMQPVLHGDDEGDEQGTSPKDGEDKTADKGKGSRGSPVAAQSASVEPTASGIAMAASPSKNSASDAKSLFDGYSFRGRKDSGSIRSSLLSDDASIDTLPAHTSSLGHADAADVTADVSGNATVHLSEQSESSSSNSLAPSMPVLPRRFSSQGPLSSDMDHVNEQGATPRPSPALLGSPPLTSDVAAAAAASGTDVVDTEDHEANALAAVMALDALEQEARAESELTPSSADAPTHSTADPVQPGEDGSNPPKGPAGGHLGQSGSLAPGAPVRKAVRITSPGRATRTGRGTTDSDASDNEDEDEWDLLDSAPPGSNRPSEVNGGKGQNLFSRGVVDTYRLLRRQDSTRVGSTLTGTSTQGSGSSGMQTGLTASGRPFSRISRQRKGLLRPSKGELRSSTPTPSDTPRKGAEGISEKKDPSTAIASPLVNKKSVNGSKSTAASDSPGDGSLGVEKDVASSPSPHSTTDASSDALLGDKLASLTFDSLSTANANANVNGNGNANGGQSSSSSSNPKRQSRIKRRFTTFFEQASASASASASAGTGGTTSSASTGGGGGSGGGGSTSPAAEGGSGK